MGHRSAKVELSAVEALSVITFSKTKIDIAYGFIHKCYNIV